MTITDSISMGEICLLHARADRALRSIIAKELEQYNLTMMEWLLLGVVCGGPKEGLSMTAIANQLDVTLPQVTALMNNVTKLRLVKQKTQKHDRRSRHVVPTNVGKDLCRQVEGAVKQGLDKWLGGVESDELEVYLRVVKVMSAKDETD